MFGSTLGDVTICLRCQVRLARVSTPRRSALVSNQRPTRVLQTRRSTTASEQVQAFPNGDGPHRRILYPHGRLRGIPGRRVREGVANLGLKTLGKPAEVIVLRDAELGLKQAPETAAEEVTEKSWSATDLLASLDAERGILPPEDVARNIEEFRTLWSQKGLEWDQWLEARKKLCGAFSTAQLTQYIVHKTQQNAVINTQNQRTSNILRKSIWTPGETPFEGFRVDNMERKRLPNMSPNLPRKEALAERVLGDCWDHHVRAEASDTGELEILLRPRDLSLLVHQSTSSH